MSTWYRDIFSLSLIAIFLFGILLGSRPLTVPDEGRYAEIPREMLVTHDYVTPHLNGIKYFEKPPLFYWMQATSIKIFGLNLWSIRLMNALMGFATCLMAYWAGRILYNRLTGFLSATILASSGLFAGMARMVTMDMTLTAMLTGTLFSFLLATQANNKKQRSHYLLLAYAFAGFATMTKGLIGILLPGAIAFFWFLVCNQWHRLKEFVSVKGILLFTGITLPWHLLAQHANHEFAHFYFLDQQFLRYFTDNTDRTKPIWFLPLITLGGLFPWCGWIVQAVKSQWQTLRRRKEPQPIHFLLLWASVIFVFFWASHSQLAPYVLPIYPPMTILIANYFTKQMHKKPDLGIWLGFLTVSVLGVLIGLFAMLRMPSSIPLIFSACLMIFGPMQSILALYKRGFQTAFITMCVVMGYFILSLCYTLPNTDVRSVKPLAEILLNQAEPDSVIANYQHYYQDLPVYLKRKILLVNWYGELKLGIQHQKTKDTWIGEKDFWKKWQNPTKMYMIMSLKDFNHLKQTHHYPLYEIARTKRDILVTNKGSHR